MVTSHYRGQLSHYRATFSGISGGHPPERDPPPCLPAQHGVLFFVKFVFARTSSGTSADVRKSDRGKRDEDLSPAGVRQRLLKRWFWSVTNVLCSVRWPHSQPVFTTFPGVLSHYRIGNVQKRTAGCTRPSPAAARSCSVTNV